MSQEDEIKQSLNLIQQAILALDKKIDAQGKRIAQLEQRSEATDFVKSSLEQVPMPPLPQAASFDEKTQRAWKENARLVEEKFLADGMKNVSGNTLEESIGGTWFMRIGITALILGISFFLKYAFDNDWIGEAGRLIIGILIGLGMLGIGEKTIRKYAMYGQMITGAGIAVLYLSIFSAFNYYQLIGSGTAFFTMIVITAVGIILSLRYDAIALMMVATIGGFATPLMASTGQNNQFGLLLFVALLDVAILIVSVFKKWRVVNVVGFAGTVVLFWAWGEKFYTKQDLGSTMFFLTLFFVIYSVSSLIYNLVEKEISTGVEQLLTLFSAIIYFGVGYVLLNGDYHPFMGFFALILAIYYFLWAFLVRNLTPSDENLYGFLAFLTVGFVTLILPIQFEQNVITIGWMVEAVLLMLIGIKLKKNPIVAFSVVVLALALFKYIFIDALVNNKGTMVIFNNFFFTSIIVVIALYLISYIVKVFSDQEELAKGRKSLFVVLMVAANLVTIFAISREITTAYDREVNMIYSRQGELERSAFDASSLPLGSNKTVNNYYDSPQYKLNQEKIEKLQNKSSISLSIFWLIYAIMLLVIGVLGKYKAVRVGGLALLLLAILKLFFVDLWSLGTLYRIISSISLGVVLLSISFVYQKYRDVIKEII